MKIISTLVWLSLAAMLSAAPKYAVVRITDIYTGLPSTAAMQKAIGAQREAIITNKRAEQLRGIIAQLQSMQADLQAKKDELDSEVGKKLIREFEIKRQEAETLRQEFEEYREEEDKRINKEMVAAMRASLERISEASRQIAAERNLDGVFDTSGNTNTGLPFVLYQKPEVPDLTEDVIAFLDEKPSDETAEAPEAGETNAAPEE